MGSENSKAMKGRKERTRGWIVQAFNRLVLSRRYEEFGVAEVAERAGVGRSTFYEHFEGKDDVLRDAVAVVLAPLATAVGDDGHELAIRGVIDHVSNHRSTTLAMLAGPGGAEIENALTELVLERLRIAGTVGARLPLPLLSRQVAIAQLGSLRAWLASEPRVCSSAQLAASMLRTTRAMVVAA